MTDIKSTAIVKYSATKEPEPYLELELNTNLNSPPEKWLQGKFGEKEQFVPGRTSTTIGKELNSFMMANNFLDYVGSVDAITDAENVKKLLKMPYSKSGVSMMVHRIGKTLLIDQFDIYRHVLMAQEDEWNWLRDFVVETLTESGESQAMIPAHAKGYGRKDIQEKLMLSKFLYYSLGAGQLTNVENDSNVNVPATRESSIVPDPLRSEDPIGISQQSNIYERNVLWRLEDIRMLVGNNMPIFGGGTHPCVSLRLRDMKKPINVLTGIDYWLDQLMCNVPEVVMCYHLNGIVQKYEVVKTEDLPNLPDCKFNPEIVRDVAQNILSFLKSKATKEGHTYWLFKGHNDDVVKLYDLTSICKEYMNEEETAESPESSSPTNSSSPFTLPVAVLMYRVARNLLQKMQTTVNASRAASTVYRLLNHCLALIDKKKCPQVFGSVHYLLAMLYITCGRPDASEKKSSESAGNSNSNTTGNGQNQSENEDDEETFDDDDLNDWFELDDDPNPNKFPGAKKLDPTSGGGSGGSTSTDLDHRSSTTRSDANCSWLSLNLLTEVDREKRQNTAAGNSNAPQTGAASSANGSDVARRMPNCSNLEDCCKTALEHIYEGFECVEMYSNLFSDQTSSSSTSTTTSSTDAPPPSAEHVPKPADTTKPIPLRYEPLTSCKRSDSSSSSSSTTTTSNASVKLLPLAVRQPAATSGSFQPELSALLLVKAATAYYLLADCAFKLENYGKALRYVNLGLLCYESLRNSFSPRNEAGGDTNHRDRHHQQQQQPSVAVIQAKRAADSLLPSVLMLCGDVHLAACHQKPHMQRKDRRDLTVQVYRDEKIAEKARKALAVDFQSEYAWCTELPESMEQNLSVSSKCYEAAGRLIKEAVISLEKSTSPKRASPSSAASNLKNSAAAGDSSNNNDPKSNGWFTSLVVDSIVVAKRHGNVKNELGLYYMNVALAIGGKQEDGKSDPKVTTERLEKYWQASYASFQEGINLFQQINDDANEALLNSNCARLMRTCAHSSIKPKERFSGQERRYLQKAMEMYSRALDCAKRKSIPAAGGSINSTESSSSPIANSIAWDLSSTYFTYATQLQERPPLGTHDQEEIERELVDYMHKALRLVENLERTDSTKRDVYLYRSSTIHYKLASLYCQSFIKKIESDKDNNKKSKQVRSLAELHYSKASDGFRELASENPCEFIRVQLERAYLLEYCMENSGAASRQKLSSDAVRLLCSCEIAFVSLSRKASSDRSMCDRATVRPSTVKSSAVDRIPTEFLTTPTNTGLNGSAGDDEQQQHGQQKVKSPATAESIEQQAQSNESKELCQVTLQRLQALCKAMVKLLVSSKGPPKETDQSLSKWKRAYASTLKTKPEEPWKMPGFVLEILQEVSKEI